MKTQDEANQIYKDYKEELLELNKKYFEKYHGVKVLSEEELAQVAGGGDCYWYSPSGICPPEGGC